MILSTPYLLHIPLCSWLLGSSGSGQSSRKKMPASSRPPTGPMPCSGSAWINSSSIDGVAARNAFPNQNAEICTRWRQDVRRCGFNPSWKLAHAKVSWNSFTKADSYDIIMGDPWIVVIPIGCHSAILIVNCSDIGKIHNQSTVMILWPENRKRLVASHQTISKHLALTFPSPPVGLGSAFGLQRLQKNCKRNSAFSGYST